jgi:hypothetical protein
MATRPTCIVGICRRQKQAGGNLLDLIRSNGTMLSERGIESTVHRQVHRPREDAVEILSTKS